MTPSQILLFASRVHCMSDQTLELFMKCAAALLPEAEMVLHTEQRFRQEFRGATEQQQEIWPRMLAELPTLEMVQVPDQGISLEDLKWG